MNLFPYKQKECLMQSLGLPMMCEQIKSFANHRLTLHRKMIASPWGGKYDNVAIINTCPLDGILSIVAILYFTSDCFQSLVKSLAENGDIVCKVLCRMFSTTDERKTILWTRARMLWMLMTRGYIHIGPLLIVKWFKISFQRSRNESDTTVGGDSYIPEYDFSSDELQVVIDPLLRSSLCKFIGDKHVWCTCCEYYNYRNNVNIEVDKLLLSWADEHPVIADSSGTQLPIQEILNLVVGHHQRYVVCRKCQEKAISRFANVTPPLLLLLSVRMFHKRHLKYNRLDAVPLFLKLRGKQYELLCLTDYLPEHFHFRAYFKLPSGLYQYDPMLLTPMKAKRVEMNEQLHEIQSILYISTNLK